LNTRNLPPAGHSIPLRAILSSFLRKEKSRDLLKGFFPGRRVFWVNSGTAALTLSLKAISLTSNRKKVILPAYSCPSVLASVIKAGLQPVLCDVNLNDFNLKTENLKLKICEDTLAVVAVHLFGIPENIFDLRELTQKKGVVLVEDAAQAFGNKILLNSFSPNTHNLPLNTNQYLGSFGDIGILSFGRGKPLSMLRGGAVLVNNSEFEEVIRKEYGSLPPELSPSFFGYFLNLIAYSTFFHPNLYWIPQRLPWLKLGETIFSLDFEVRKLNSNVLELGKNLILNFEKVRKRRGDLAKIYREKLGKIKEEFLYFPEVNEEAMSLLRFPLVLRRKEKRDPILNILREKGLGATGMYPVPLNEQRGIPKDLFKGESYPNAKHHSERILTLPLHEHVSINDIEIICQDIEKHLPTR